MKDLSRLRSGVNHGILAFTFLVIIVDSVLCGGFTLYANQGKSVTLSCSLQITTNSTQQNQVTWFFTSDGANETKVPCESDSLYDCKLQAPSNGLVNSFLEIKKVKDGNYGVYVCRTPSDFASVTLKDEIRPTVRIIENEKWVVTKGLRVEQGQDLELNCFVNGTGEEHEVKWKWIPEKYLQDDSTDNDNDYKDVSFGTGLFANFTKQTYNEPGQIVSYKGPATFDLRGTYICEVKLRNPNDSSLHSLKFPVNSPKTIVRIVEKNQWFLPALILLGEIIVLGIFTLIINWRESKEGTTDGDFVGEEDEEYDEEPKKED